MQSKMGSDKRVALCGAAEWQAITRGHPASLQPEEAPRFPSEELLLGQAEESRHILTHYCSWQARC